jgi:hypothetical protein
MVFSCLCRAKQHRVVHRFPVLIERARSLISADQVAKRSWLGYLACLFDIGRFFSITVVLLRRMKSGVRMRFGRFGRLIGVLGLLVGSSSMFPSSVRAADPAITAEWNVSGVSVSDLGGGLTLERGYARLWKVRVTNTGVTDLTISSVSRAGLVTPMSLCESSIVSVGRTITCHVIASLAEFGGAVGSIQSGVIKVGLVSANQQVRTIELSLPPFDMSAYNPNLWVNVHAKNASFDGVSFIPEYVVHAGWRTVTSLSVSSGVSLVCEGFPVLPGSVGWCSAPRRPVTASQISVDSVVLPSEEFVANGSITGTIASFGASLAAPNLTIEARANPQETWGTGTYILPNSQLGYGLGVWLLSVRNDGPREVLLDSILRDQNRSVLHIAGRFDQGTLFCSPPVEVYGHAWPGLYIYPGTTTTCGIVAEQSELAGSITNQTATLYFQGFELPVKLPDVTPDLVPKLSVSPVDVSLRNNNMVTISYRLSIRSLLDIDTAVSDSRRVVCAAAGGEYDKTTTCTYDRQLTAQEISSRNVSIPTETFRLTTPSPASVVSPASTFRLPAYSIEINSLVSSIPITAALGMSVPVTITMRSAAPDDIGSVSVFSDRADDTVTECYGSPYTPGTVWLPRGSTIQCSASFTVSQADIDAGAITASVGSFGCRRAIATNQGGPGGRFGSLSVMAPPTPPLCCYIQPPVGTGAFHPGMFSIGAQVGCLGGIEAVPATVGPQFDFDGNPAGSATNNNVLRIPIAGAPVLDVVLSRLSPELPRRFHVRLSTKSSGTFFTFSIPTGQIPVPSTGESAVRASSGGEAVWEFDIDDPTPTALTFRVDRATDAAGTLLTPSSSDTKTVTLSTCPTWTFDSTAPPGPVVCGVAIDNAGLVATIVRNANDAAGNPVYTVTLTLTSRTNAAAFDLMVTSGHIPDTVVLRPGETNTTHRERVNATNGIATWEYVLKNPRGVFTAQAFGAGSTTVIASVEVK